MCNDARFNEEESTMWTFGIGTLLLAFLFATIVNEVCKDGKTTVGKGKK